jgi:hypothetical protein
MAVAFLVSVGGPSFNRQLPKQFLPASDRGCPWKATRRGGLLLLTGILNLPVAGHSRHFGSSADYFRSSPLETDIVRAVAMSQNCQQATYRQGNVLSGCKPIHIPQSAAAVSFDLKSRRLRSRFESSALVSTWSFENPDCSETQTLILNSGRACCEPAGGSY